jgi:hypothetical protein
LKDYENFTETIKIKNFDYLLKKESWFNLVKESDNPRNHLKSEE